MRILVVCQYYYPENVVITPICEALVKRGNEVQVITGKPNYGFGHILPGYEQIKDETINGVKVHRLPLVARKKSRISLIRNYLSFWRNAKHYLSRLKEEYDLVYSMSMSPLISVEGGGIYAKKHGKPHVIHCLDLWPESAVIAGKVRKNSFVYRVLYHSSKKIYSSADEILISSPSFALYFQDVLKLPDKKVFYVPQPPLVNPLPEKGVAFPKRFNLVYAGNIGNLQLIENYVKACALLKGEKDFQFHIVGAGARLNAVLRLIEENHLEDLVVYHPLVSAAEVPSYFTNATALLVPLADTSSPVSKTIPNKLISSLAYSRPILASIGGDGRDILTKAGGALFAKEDPADIASAIKKLVALSDEERKTMGEKNKAYFEEHFNFDKVMDQLFTAFKDLKKS
jgi:glycosyltransferase involved in cell wall biosynthesis